MAEIIDVVDLDDRVIDQASKEKCHRDGLYHRGVSIMVFRTEDMEDLLVQERSSKVAIKPGHLCLAGGHVKKGESYNEAAGREFEEELYSYLNRNPDLEELFKLQNTLDEDDQFVKVFRTVDPGPFDPLLDEVSGIRFENIEVIINEVETEPDSFMGITRLIIEEYEDRFL